MKSLLIQKPWLVFILFFLVVVNSGCDIIDPQEPAVFSVNPGKNIIEKGKTFQFTIQQLTKDGRNAGLAIVFRSKNPDIATVNRHGIVTGKKQGNAKIEIMCGDKSFISEISVVEEEQFGFHRTKYGVVADNGTLLLEEIGGYLGTGHVTNFFGDNKAYWQIMYSIKNISKRNLFIDPDNFVMLGDNKEVIRSSNSRLNRSELLKKQWLEPGKSIDHGLVVFLQPHADFKLRNARIRYDDKLNPGIIYKIQN